MMIHEATNIDQTTAIVVERRKRGMPHQVATAKVGKASDDFVQAWVISNRMEHVNLKLANELACALRVVTNWDHGI